MTPIIQFSQYEPPSAAALKEPSEKDLMQIAREVGSNIHRVRWDNSKIDAIFGRRSMAQIYGDGNTFYMNPCLDLTLAALPLVCSKGFKCPKFIAEELFDSRYGPEKRLHFAIEAGRFFLDFEGLANVRVGRGKYFNKKQCVTSVKISKLDALRIGAKDTLADILDAPLQDFNLQKMLRLLKQSNTDENWEKYVSDCGRDPSRLRIIYEQTS